ncbi:FAS-associated factor 1 [Tupaia chinensis]|uniref:FAS-associated factor 1 n=1 Tax=Tupaia chinensis TaxID=246437 RepID=L9LAK1_TUPCH|nr:FAS-associated factor 1 [Tupaia chinensis]
MASNVDRETILADFQACTFIENIDEAITLLEQNNWDLVAAINGVIPQENGILQSEYGDVPPPSSSSHAGALQESSNQNFMLIITHQDVQREYSLNLSGSSTIQEEKTAAEQLKSHMPDFRRHGLAENSNGEENNSKEI